MKQAIRIAHFDSAAWAIAMVLSCFSVRTFGQQQVIHDPIEDAVIRRTDAGNDGLVDTATHRIPDLSLIRLGNFAPQNPSGNRFSGSWTPSGQFFRVDLVVAGVMNPPGTLGFDPDYPQYQPFRYGPNPVFGWVEFDLDADANTGGEVDAPQFRYLGNVARFGGVPQMAPWQQRAAIDFSAFDGDLETTPFVERSGEEFHIAFLGEEIESIDVVNEKLGGDPMVFEAGETWLVEGRMFHRSHGAEVFTYQCPYGDGRYKPEVTMRYAHDVTTNQTTISLVYPLTNAASGQCQNPNQPPQPLDGCASNQNSILEALSDLKWGAANATFYDRLDPRFVLLEGWENKTPEDYLDIANWQVNVLLGTTYSVKQVDDAWFVWTDLWPNVRCGDFTGDCQIDQDDQLLIDDYVTSHDGLAAYDSDLDSGNRSLTLVHYGDAPCLFDTNNDGLVRFDDTIVLGDLDLNQVFDLNDGPAFIQALLDPVAYSNEHGGVGPAERGDLNCDGVANGLDIAAFVDRLCGI